MAAPKRDRYEVMTKTPVNRLIPRLAVPTVISMLVTGIYNAADTFFVGRISTEATAAVGVVFSVMALIQAFGFFCGQGAGGYVSRKLGSGEMDKAARMAATGFVLAFLIGLAFAAAGLMVLEPMARFLGATPAILDETMAYMRIILMGSPFMMSQLVLNNVLRFQGSAVYAMVGLVSGALLNIGLDPLLIFGAGMGVAGAALATVVSQIVSFAILLIGSGKGQNIRIDLRNTRLTAEYFREIANGGTPSLCRQGLASVATILMNGTAGALGGEAAIAGMSVVNRCMMLANSALIGFGQGFQPVCAFNYGARLYGRVREGYRFCVKNGTIFLLIVSVICFVFSPQIVEFFRRDPAVVAVGSRALRFQACVFPLNATIVITNMMLQAIGKGVKGSIMASARSGLFFVPAILILPRLFGLTGVEMTQTAADLCAFLLAVPMAGSELSRLAGLSADS